MKPVASIPRSPVPFLDLTRLHSSVAGEILSDFEAIVASSGFIGGPHVSAFEEEFSEFCGLPHAVGLSSGLDALRLTLQQLGIGCGDEVIVPAMTFVATFEAVSQVGATPVPVDIGRIDYCMDPDAAAAAVTSRTAAILPVHLYGQLADMRRLSALAALHGLPVVEDACQAHGAVRDGVGAGALGVAAAFSFYPGKNLGAMGDAGALVTRDPGLAAGVRALREHGQSRKYEHSAIGWTARLDAVQAMVLRHKLIYLPRWNAARTAAARHYSSFLAGVGDLVLPLAAPKSNHVWHLFVIRTADPTGLASFLADRGVATGRHYPTPPHLSEAYSALEERAGAFPVAEAVAAECLSLPIFPGITDEELDDVVAGVSAWFDG